MTTKSYDWTQLHNLLQQDLKTSTQLFACIQQERNALETRNYEQFQQVISEKQIFLTSLENNSSHRQQWLNTAGFKDEKQVLSIAKKHAPKVAHLWLELKNIWTQCQTLNEVNEQIASRTHMVVGKILDTLRGQNQHQKLYTDKGHTQASSNGRTISNA